MKEVSSQEAPASQNSTGSPETHNPNLVANRGQEPLLDEAVEAGLMSRWVGHPTIIRPCINRELSGMIMMQPAHRGRNLMNRE